MDADGLCAWNTSCYQLIYFTPMVLLCGCLHGHRQTGFNQVSSDLASLLVGGGGGGRVSGNCMATCVTQSIAAGTDNEVKLVSDPPMQD